MALDNILKFRTQRAWSSFSTQRACYRCRETTRDHAGGEYGFASDARLPREVWPRFPAARGVFAHMPRRCRRVAAHLATIVFLYGCDRDLAPTPPHSIAPSPKPAAIAGTAGQLGAWSAPLSWPIVAAHSSVLPDGRVLTWNSSDVPGDQEQHTVWAWNPVTGSFVEFTNGSHNVFCAGQVFLPDGRLLVAGGHISDNKGVKQAAIFNSTTNSWDPAASMRAGRWYPTMTLLVDGKVTVVAGSDENASGNTLAEVWDGSAWRTLDGASLNLSFYPWMHSAPDGRVFMSGPEATSRFLNPSGTGEWTEAAKSTGGFREYGSSVMYAPGKILIMGGGDPPTNSAETIDLNVGGGWRPTGPMQFRRRQMSATVLPDGRVLAVGGTQGAGFNDESQRVLAPEVWDPSTGMWTTLASMQIGRQYHSTAVLLPDARILVAGGGRCAACLVDHRDAEIFSPPYLFASDGSPAQRPVVSSAPTSVGYGQTFTVSTPDAATITRVTWVRLPSTTHSFNQNQWFNQLSFSQGSGGLTVATPPNAYQAPPGHYMLYILNGSGVPSVAKVVQLTGSAALPPAPGPPAAPSGLTPLDQTIALSWVDNSTSETAFDIERCQEANCSDFVKIGSVGPNVTRYSDATVTAGATYRYRVRAENGAGFSAYSNTATATASTGPAALPIVNRLSGRCADVQWAGRAPGTPVVIWDCQQQAPNQSFTLQSVGVSGPIQVYGSMCLDVAGGAGTDGAGIVIQTCTGAPSQVWTQTAANQLRGINGKCVDLTSAGTANGTLLVLGPCASTANQQWRSVTGGDRTATPIITHSCTGLGCTFDSGNSTDDVGIVSRSWDFGDGTTAGNVIAPVKDYQAPGTYVVTLGVTDGSWQTARERVSVTVSASTTPNNPPVAAFTQSCTGLTCAFTDGSTDADGSITARSWTFGDGATSSQTNPSRTYAAAGTYTVTLTVTDDDGAPSTTSKSITVSAPPPPPPISLTATGAKVKGIQQVTLRWSGATSTSVQVRRTGTTSATFNTPNDGLHVDNLDRKGSATYTYQVCEVGTSKCSAEIAVVFN